MAVIHPRRRAIGLSHSLATPSPPAGRWRWLTAPSSSVRPPRKPTQAYVSRREGEQDPDRAADAARLHLARRRQRRAGAVLPRGTGIFPAGGAGCARQAGHLRSHRASGNRKQERARLRPAEYRIKSLEKGGPARPGTPSSSRGPSPMDSGSAPWYAWPPTLPSPTPSASTRRIPAGSSPWRRRHSIRNRANKKKKKKKNRCQKKRGHGHGQLRARRRRSDAFAETVAEV